FRETGPAAQEGGAEGGSRQGEAAVGAAEEAVGDPIRLLGRRIVEHLPEDGVGDAEGIPGGEGPQELLDIGGGAALAVARGGAREAELAQEEVGGPELGAGAPQQVEREAEARLELALQARRRVGPLDVQRLSG